MNKPNEDKKDAEGLSKEMKVACCKCCLLAQAMKDCKSCPFNIGLIESKVSKVG